MDREVELQAVITPMERRTYPETRSHFSMALYPYGKKIAAMSKNYPSAMQVVKWNHPPKMQGPFSEDSDIGLL